LKRDRQSWKQLLETVSTDAGRQMDRSDEHSENADAPRIEILEPDSNVKLRRFEQRRKHPLESVSIDEGRQIDSSDEAE
jgi:hypothetical protein